MYEPGFNKDLAFCDMYIRLTIPQRSSPHSVCLKPRVKVETMVAMRKEQSNILPTDDKPIASLLDPECEIPPDIHFEIYDEAGTMQGLLGGHKNRMALRSPVFKTMFFWGSQ